MIRNAWMCAVAVVAATPAWAQSKAPAVARAEAFIGLLLKVKPDEGKLTAADKAANEKAFSELDGFFDFDHLTSTPIAPRADKFSPPQRAEFTKKFKEVIRLRAYPNSGSFFKKAQYTFGQPKEKDGVVTVAINAKVVKDDLETTVDLHFKKDGMKIVDVSFDGDSLVKDYQNQMVRIIDKEGVKGLIDRVEKARADIVKDNKG